MSSAKEKALDYLGRFSRTERQLTQYLSRKGFEPQEISETLAYLREQHFLDDQAFAVSFIQSRIERCDGPLKIKQMLFQKGIDPATADRLLQESYPSHLQLERAKVLLHKRVRARHASPLQAKERKRLLQFLASRGFYRYVIIQAFDDHEK